MKWAQTGFRGATWRTGLLLAGLLVFLVGFGVWLYQLERTAVLERGLQQEHHALLRTAAEMEFILLHCWQDGHYLAKLFEYHVDPLANGTPPFHQRALHHFLVSHPAFYRVVIRGDDGRIYLDTLNQSAPGYEQYAGLNLASVYSVLADTDQVGQQRLVDLGFNGKTNERMMALVYPIRLEPNSNRRGTLVILTSLQVLLPRTLLAERMEQQRISVLNEQHVPLIGGPPDPAVVRLLQNDAQYKRRASPEKRQTLHGRVDSYQAAPVHLAGFHSDWLLLRKLSRELTDYTIPSTSWVFAVSAVGLIVGFFILIYFLALRKLALVVKAVLPEQDTFAYNAVIDIPDEKMTKQVLVEANQVLHRLAHVDALTGLSNRRAFDFSLAREWQKAEKYHEPLSLIMIDVDHFKAFNDLYGHKAGDECLQRVAHALRIEVRRMSDVVARYGGEEFALILPNTPLHEVTKIAWMLRQRVFDLNIPHQGAPEMGRVTISCGVACVWPYHGYSVDDLLHLADQALYKAKGLGRNTVQ